MQAFHELYQLYADILFSFGMIYRKEPELVKDYIHDLFFDLYKYRKNLADNDHIRNYLFKSLKRKIQSGKGGKLNLIYTVSVPEETGLKNYTRDEEEREFQEENLVKIRVAMKKLTDRQQEILNLRFQVGLTYPEIAVILDISVESVRTQVYRAVKTIREELNVTSGPVVLFYLYSAVSRKVHLRCEAMT